jgi:photosystem II stability/assembly factor-like uncharacterized protein
MSARQKTIHWLGVIVLLSTVMAMTPIPSMAQGPEPPSGWQPTNLPAGGWVQDLVTHPATPGRVYALLQDTSPFRSDDSGLTWQRIASGLPFEPTAVRLYNTLVVDPLSPDVLYLGLGASGFSGFAHIYRSTDGGASWAPRGNGIPAVEVNDIAISPQNPQILYAATHDGVYRSTDGGANWQSRGHSGSWVRAVAADPANGNRVIILIGGEVYASDDGGASWHAASVGLPSGSGSSPSARLIFDPAAPGTAYLTGLIVQGFHRSIDGGETWTAVNDGFGIVIPTLTGIALRPGTATEIYVATASGVYRLDGSSWTRLSLDLEAEMTNFPHALGLDAASGTFFLGYWHGVYRSTDGGATWAPTGPGLNSARVEAVGVDPDNGQRVFAAAGNRLFRSTDGGASWTPALPRETVRGYMVAVDPHNTNHVYYSVHLAPLRHSLDGGLTWTDAPSAVSLPYDVRSIRFHRTNPQRLYLVGPHNFSSHTTEQGVYKSTDGGQTWQHLEDQLRAVELALSADGATVYAASISQIIRTVDDGVTWMQAHGGLPPGWGFVHGLEAHPTDPNVAWVATGGAGVFRTVDRGATWQPMNDGLPGGYVTDLAVRPADGDAVLYAGTRFGVYVSRSGQPWVPLGTGLPDYAQWTNSLAVTPSGRIYLGTDFGALWTLQDGGGVEPSDPCRGIPLGRGQIWLAETGFAVQGMWLDWFNDHGGLDILGFPRSPVTADPMDPGQCVQYFQRGILEWHPENPDPWRIQRRLLVDIMMPGIDPAVSPARANGPDYWYFPQTGHAVSNYAPNGSYIGFKWFFDRHGREDTFGYPMEEPKRRRGQDGVERWTQRFQAALFEYHAEYDIPGLKPGTNIPWRNWIVELGLLGDHYIAQNNLQFGVICSQAPMLGFGKVWHDNPRVQQRLRCPAGLEVGQTVVEQPFQHGWMFRRDDTDQIYVVRDTGAWSVYPDTWQPGEPETDPTIDVPSGVYQPRQGLGKVWRMLSHPPVHDGGGLYWAVSPDRAFRGSAQDYEHGTMVWSDRRVIYVFYDDGTWESYTDYFGQ